MDSQVDARPAALVMARFWGSGPVKTRLAKDLGQETAREVYRRMVEGWWAELEAPGLARHLWVSPADQLQACAAWLPGAEAVTPQVEGDLGTRMLEAFRATRGHPWCAVVGTDCPALDAARVLAAGTALDHADLSLVPTFDGGYALLACRRPYPELFAAMPWSSDEVLDLTLQRAEALDLTVHLEPKLRDLDTLEDLHQLQREGWLRDVGAADGP